MRPSRHPVSFHAACALDFQVSERSTSKDTHTLLVDFMERTILCFGDSNTHGSRAMRHPEDRRRFPKSDRWPGIMADCLAEDWTVVEEGLPGRTSVFDDPIEGEHKNGVRTLRALLETHRDLDLVIIMLGTNDLKSRFSVSAEDIALGLERLVVETKNSDVGRNGSPPEVLLVAPVPIREVGFLGAMFTGGRKKSVALGTALASVAKRQDVAFVDLAAVASVDPLDGIHLNREAHLAIGRAIAQAVGDLAVPNGKEQPSSNRRATD